MSLGECSASSAPWLASGDATQPQPIVYAWGMSIKVIGAGFGRTGTLSLKQALETLGFAKCYHMVEVAQNLPHARVWLKASRGGAIDWPALFQGYQSTVDWPSCNFYLQQMAAFPEAKVLLSLRDPEDWYKSVMSTIYPNSIKALESGDEAARQRGRWAMDIIWNPVFGGRVDEPNHAMGVFQAHNEAVQRAVPNERLLIFEASQGWPPLCDFLSLPIPDQPYPHTNTTQEFQQATQR